MRVLFVGGVINETEGGASTFVQTIKDALAGHPLFGSDWFYSNPVALNHDISTLHPEWIWFLGPLFYRPVEQPFTMTVWDIGHRALPEFPEVSLSGWTFEARERFYQFVLPRAASVIIGTESGARHLEQYYNIDRAIVIPLPVGKRVAAHYPTVETPFLLYPAQFWPHKNHVTVIDALKELADFKLVLPGSDKGNLAYIKEYTKLRGVEDRIIFPGFVDRATLAGYYEMAYALVYASLMGPDNLPPLEAMSYGCPVICADYPGARDQLGIAAIYFSPLSVYGLVTILTSLSNGRNEMVENGYKCVADRTGTHYIQMIEKHLHEQQQLRRLWGRSYTHT